MLTEALPVLISSTFRGMTRLSWPGWLG